MMRLNRCSLAGIGIAALMMSACRVVIDTRINPDGSGVLRNAVVYSAEEQKNFEQAPGNESASICDSVKAGLPADATFSEEQHGDEAYCVTARSFADLQELRQLYAQLDNVSVRELQFGSGRLTVDIDIDLTQEGDEQKVAQEWRLTLPGTIETHNADEVDGQTLIWSISPGEHANVHAETRVGLSLQSLGATGMAVLAGAFGCLAGALGVGAFYWSRRRKRTAAGNKVVSLTGTQDMAATEIDGQSSAGNTGLKQFLMFIAIGSFFATVEELLTVVVIRHDLASYVFTLLILFPLFLAFVWWSSRLIDRLVHPKPAQELAYFFVYGAIGLLIEWFLLGLAPWRDPDANPLVMLMFQIGMFSFWATVAFAPRLLTGAQSMSKNTGKTILKFYVPYFAVVYIISFLVPEETKFGTIIALIVFGYTALNLLYLRYFLQSFASAAAPAT